MSLKPKIITAREAALLIPSGSSVMFGGFVGCGAAHEVIGEMSKNEKMRNIRGIMDDSALAEAPDGGGSGPYAWAKLIRTGQMASYVGGHLGTNPEAEKLWAEGKLKVDLVPQGSLAEMIRAGGCGLGGVITPAGVGTLVEESPHVETKMTIGGRDYLVMKPLRADFAVLSGYIVDKRGNTWYKGSTCSFSPHMAMAADVVIVEAENLVEVGGIEPENVMTPGILVDYIVVRGRGDGQK